MKKAYSKTLPSPNLAENTPQNKQAAVIIDTQQNPTDTFITEMDKQNILNEKKRSTFVEKND